MSPEEDIPLRNLGISLLGTTGAIIAMTFFLGFLTFLMMYATVFALFRLDAQYKSSLQYRSSRRKLNILAISYFSFLIATVNWALWVAHNATLIHVALVDNPTLPINARLALGKIKVYELNIAKSWFASLVPIVNDAVILWRSWVLSPDHKWGVFVTFFLWSSTVVISFAQLGLISNFHGLGIFNAGTSQLTANLFVVSIALSLATNAAAIMSITYGLWAHRRFLAIHLGGYEGIDRVQKILGLLVDSGAVYCAPQLITLLLNMFPFRSRYTAVNIAAEILYTTYTELAAMYPTLVMFLAEGEGSFAKNYAPRAEDGLRPTSSLHISCALKHLDLENTVVTI
ncbi:hypothetical protein FPV67DRAFT_620521 [Lyophyllum atratum]|nr:hypothetical protein FPV67DRAFT_620521 [Lyophyllum atratum]